MILLVEQKFKKLILGTKCEDVLDHSYQYLWAY